METGTIKTKTDRGFGFITAEGRGGDLFFHSNELVGVTFEDLQVGDKVQFEISKTEKGDNAIKVSRVEMQAEEESEEKEEAEDDSEVEEESEEEVKAE